MPQPPFQRFLDAQAHTYDQALELDRVFHRQFAKDFFAKSVDDQRNRVFL